MSIDSRFKESASNARSARAAVAIVAIAVLALAGACGGSTTPADVDEVPVGTEIEVETSGGTTIAGRLTDVRPDAIRVEQDRGASTEVRRSEIAEVRRRNDERTGPAPLDLLKREPEYREITIPAGTVVPLVLESRVASDASRVEDPVRARTRSAVSIDGVDVLPQGTAVAGTITAVERSGKVKGRARVAFRFDELTLTDPAGTYPIRSRLMVYEAESTVKEDAAKIGLPAAGGAIVGAIAGGKKGAAIGSAVGGGAGTAVVLTTRGEEVRLGAGASVRMELAEPVVVRVPAGAGEPSS